MDKPKPPRIFIYPGFKTLHGSEFNSRPWLTSLTVSRRILPGRFSGCRLLQSGTCSCHWCVNGGPSRQHADWSVVIGINQCVTYMLFILKKEESLSTYDGGETSCLFSKRRPNCVKKWLIKKKKNERAKSSGLEVAEIAENNNVPGYLKTKLRQLDWFLYLKGFSPLIPKVSSVRKKIGSRAPCMSTKLEENLWGGPERT